MEIGRSVEEVRHLAACSCFDISCAVSALNAVKSDSDIKPNPSYPKLSYFDVLKNIRSTIIRLLFCFFVCVLLLSCVCVNFLYHCRLSALFCAFLATSHNCTIFTYLVIFFCGNLEFRCQLCHADEA